MFKNKLSYLVMILLSLGSINVPVNEKKIEVLEKEPIIEEKKEEIVLETIIGRASAYGPDCKGCHGGTAAGYSVKNGNIFYQDKEYGKIRILAGDKSYPFGTIVKITGIKYFGTEPFYGIVLDRGGGIGKTKKFLFDILVSSEKESSSVGAPKNVKFEILRLGY